MPDNLDDARDKIDKIDNEILNLLEKRAKLALDTSVFKKNLGSKNIFDDFILLDNSEFINFSRSVTKDVILIIFLLSLLV